MHQHNLRNLTDYEKRQIDAINSWLKSPPSIPARLMDGAESIIGWATGKILPDSALELLRSVGPAVQQAIPAEQIAHALEGAMHTNMWLADQWADQQSILDTLAAHSFEDLKHCDLERLDEAASSVHNWAIGYASLTGAASGLGGIFAAVPGVLAVINISLRTIRKIGLCYGYNAMDDMEKRFIYNVLALGGAAQTQKVAIMVAIREIEVMVARKTFKAMAERAALSHVSKEAVITTVRAAASNLGYQLTKQRILTSVPLIGGGVGLFLDGNYLHDIGWAATHSYQRRWLIENGKWPNRRSADRSRRHKL